MSLLSFFSNLLTGSSAQNKQNSSQDAYLPCKDYLNHPLTLETYHIAEFQNGERLYFVVYNLEGKVSLRSEGFDSVEARKSELAEVIRLKDDESAYTIRQYGDKVLKILNDDTGREIGRSCLE